MSYVSCAQFQEHQFQTWEKVAPILISDGIAVDLFQ